MSTNHNLFEEKGEPKRIRTEVPLLTMQPNALLLGQTGSLGNHVVDQSWYSAVLRSRAYSLRSCCMWFWMSDRNFLQCVLNTYIHQSGVLTALSDCYMAGATWNCCRDRDSDRESETETVRQGEIVIIILNLNTLNTLYVQPDKLYIDIINWISHALRSTG